MRIFPLVRFRSVFPISAALLLSACSGGDSGSDPVLGGSETRVPAPVPLVSGYQPAVATTWHWQLSGTLNDRYAVDLYDIDLFDTSAEKIAGLQASGKRVICYFSAGSWENWRADAAQFSEAVQGNVLAGWPNERWLDIRSNEVLTLMKARLDLAVSKGCDGVEPDNVDGYINSTGFDLSAADQLWFNRTLANEAHLRGLAVGLKNDLAQVEQLVDYFDFSVNEQCHSFKECAALKPFIDAGKPVFNAEYASHYVTDATRRAMLCDESRQLGLRTLVLPKQLNDSFRFSCD